MHKACKRLSAVRVHVKKAAGTYTLLSPLFLFFFVRKSNTFENFMGRRPHCKNTKKFENNLDLCLTELTASMDS